MNDEIIAGLRNALERGYSLEEAVQSFINAGYNAADVKGAAASFVQGGASQVIQPIVSAQANFSSPIFQAPPEAPLSTLAPVKPLVATKKKSGNKILIIGLIILLLIVVGAILSLTVFRSQLSSLLGI